MIIDLKKTDSIRIVPYSLASFLRTTISTMHYCDQCCTMCYSKHGLIEHKQFHGHAHMCQLCRYSFRTKYGLYIHKQETGHRYPKFGLTEKQIARFWATEK